MRRNIWDSLWSILLASVFIGIFIYANIKVSDYYEQKRIEAMEESTDQYVIEEYPEIVIDSASQDRIALLEDRIENLEDIVDQLLIQNEMQNRINNLILDIIEEMSGIPQDIDPLLLSQVIESIEQVESGGDMNAVGDDGRSIGSFQIGEMYWKDAVKFDSSLGGVYTDVATNREYAIRVMLTYWKRYARTWEPEELARLHVGGPYGPFRESSVPYWNKVQKEMMNG